MFLEQALPVATLLFGPASIGKWTLAEHLVSHHRIDTIDCWRIQRGFTVDIARAVTHFAARAPYGRYKVILARLDGASPQALNAILKTLEEPPPTVKFIFTTASTTLPTVASRCVTFQLGLLSDDQLIQLYLDQGFTRTRAVKAAAYARGQVKRGYEADADRNHTDQVRALIKAITSGDREGFSSCFAKWDQHTSELLTTFLTECLKRNFVVFTEADTCGLVDNRTQLWHMVQALGSYQNARPRLGVRAALEPFLIRR